MRRLSQAAFVLFISIVLLSTTARAALPPPSDAQGPRVSDSEIASIKAGKIGRRSPTAPASGICASFVFLVKMPRGPDERSRGSCSRPTHHHRHGTISAGHGR